MKIQIPYSPRNVQAYIHQEIEKKRYSLLCLHRRCGKTTLCLNHLIKAAMTNKNHNPRYAYIAPTYKQAKSIAFDFLKYYTKNIPGTKFNESELRADFLNGSRISLLSSENPDSIRGIYLDGCIIDEAAQINPSLIDEVVTPALSDRKGFMVMCGTPKGVNNIFYDYYQKAQADNNWFLYKAKASDTKIVDQEELDAALSVMGKAKYDQEFECSFIGNISGSIYGDLVQEIDDKSQIGSVPYDPAYPVSTAIDLGFSDSTSIIFFQKVNHSIHIIDSYENNNQALPHYIQYIKDKPYFYETHYAPHDLEQHDFGTGKTRREVAYQLGVNFRIAPRLPLEDGIHAVKMILPRCRIDSDKCKKLLIALRHYHRKYNDKDRVYKIKPVHDFSSHFCDAIRCLATGLEENKIINNKHLQQVAESNYEVI
jgi:phage terminase large subunit